MDVDKLRERLVAGNRIDSPVFLMHPPTAEHYDIGEVTPLSGTALELHPVPLFPSKELLAQRDQLKEEVRTLNLDLTQERLRSTEIAKMHAQASGAQTPIPPQFVEMMEKSMETNSAMMRANQENSNKQVEVFKELIQAAQKTPTAAKKKSSVLQVKPEIKWPKLGDDGPGGKEIEIFYERFEEVASICNDGEGMSDREMLLVLKSNLSDSKR